MKIQLQLNGFDIRLTDLMKIDQAREMKEEEHERKRTKEPHMNLFFRFREFIWLLFFGVKIKFSLHTVKKTSELIKIDKDHYDLNFGYDIASYAY